MKKIELKSYNEKEIEAFVDGKGKFYDIMSKHVDNAQEVNNANDISKMMKIDNNTHVGVDFMSNTLMNEYILRGIDIYVDINNSAYANGKELLKIGRVKKKINENNNKWQIIHSTSEDSTGTELNFHETKTGTTEISILNDNKQEIKVVFSTSGSHKCIYVIDKNDKVVCKQTY